QCVMATSVSCYALVIRLSAAACGAVSAPLSSLAIARSSKVQQPQAPQPLGAVAQWIERRRPKAGVAGSIPASPSATFSKMVAARCSIAALVRKGRRSGPSTHAYRDGHADCTLIDCVMGMRLSALLIVLSGFVLSGCVTVSVGPIPATPMSEPSRAVSAGKGFGLIPDHNGQIVTVDADTDLIRLVLDDGWAWKVDVDPAFLQLQQYGPLQGQGFTAQFWLYKLVR